MKALVLVVFVVAAALAADVPREIKEKQTVVEALPDAFQAPGHFDESKGPFHFGELRSIKPIVNEKVFGSQQLGSSRVDVKEYQVAQPLVTAYSAAPVGQFEKVVKTVETLPGATVYSAAPAAAAEYHVHEYQQPSTLLVKSVQEQVPVAAYQQTYVASQPAAALYKTEKVEEKFPLLTGDVQRVEKIEKVEKVEKIEGEKVEGEKVEKVEKVELPAATAYSGGYEQSAFIQKQPALASLNGYRSVYSQPAYFSREVVSSPAVTTYVSKPATYQQTTYTQEPAFAFGKKIVSHEAVPVISTYSANFPAAASGYKKESTVYSAAPVVSTYSSNFPAASAYKKESTVYSAAPAVATYTTNFPAAYKKESTVYSAAPAVSTYSSNFPGYKKESSVYQTGYIAQQPAVSSYKQVISTAAPAVSNYKQESVFGQSGYVAQPVISSYKQVSSAPVLSGYKQESVFGQTGYVAQPAVTSYSATVQPLVQPAVSYKKEIISAPAAFQKTSNIYSQSAYGLKSVASSPVVSSYKKEVVSAPAVSTYSSLPAASFKKESSVFGQSSYVAQPLVSTVFAAQPAVSTYKTYTSSTPVISTYSSSVPAASSAFKKESTVYSAAPAVATYTTNFPASSAFKKESTVYSAAPAVATYTTNFPAAYKKESTVYSAAPAVSTYSSNFPGYKKESSVYQTGYVAQQPAVSSYKQVISTAAPVVSSYKQESVFGQSGYVAQPSIATYKQVSTAPVLSGYKQESTIVKSSPTVSAYGASSLYGQSGSTYQKDSLLYSQSAHKYGGAAMFPTSYQSSADGSSSILKLYKEGDGSGIYQYGYATSNGINFDEEGKVYAYNTRSGETKDDGASAVTGSYSYVGPDGVTYTVKYIADEHGFRAFGDHLPKLSEEAQRALELGAKEADKYDEEGRLKHHY